MPRRKFAPLPGNGYLLMSFVDYARKETHQRRFALQTELFAEIRALKIAIKAHNYKLLEVGTEGCDYDVYDGEMDIVAQLRVYGLSKPNVVAANEEGEVTDIGELAEPERAKPGRKPRKHGTNPEGAYESL